MTEENHEKMHQIVNKCMKPLVEEIKSLVKSERDYEDIHLCVGEYLNDELGLYLPEDLPKE
jgi:hypothetical protein